MTDDEVNVYVCMYVFICVKGLLHRSQKDRKFVEFMRKLVDWLPYKQFSIESFEVLVSSITPIKSDLIH